MSRSLTLVEQVQGSRCGRGVPVSQTVQGAAFGRNRLDTIGLNLKIVERERNNRRIRKSTMASPGAARRRRPLYPFAWGSGKRAFDATYKCYSVAAAGRDDLENGDKILLPEKAFREVSRLRLEFPLTMMARNARKAGVPSQGRGSGRGAGRSSFGSSSSSS